MKHIKKTFTLLLSLAALTACGTNEVKEEVVEEQPLRTVDLIENIRTNDDQKVLATKENGINNNEVIEENEKVGDTDSNKNQAAEKTETVTLIAGGDLMANMGQTEYAYNKGGGNYDYSESFMYVSDFIKDADIAIANYETTTNPNVPYAGHPRFNAPGEYLEAISKAGFDIVTTANNHSLDTDLEGVDTTIAAIEDAGLDHVGTRAEGDESRFIIKKVNDINIAFLSYTYGCNGIEDLFQVREEVDQVNYLHEEEIKKDIEDAKEEGADFVVVYPHWGIELRSDADTSQIELGRKMIDWGADLVIGNHPHVVEPYEEYESEDGRKGFIAYACGNFISIQNLETVNDIRTEQSVAYKFELSKDFANGKTSIDKFEAYPLWVGMTYNDYGRSVRTYVAEDFLDGGKYYDEANENQKDRIQKAYDATTATITSEVNY